jgi:hypothetical protein
MRDISRTMYSKQRLYNIELMLAFVSKQSENPNPDFFEDKRFNDRLFILSINYTPTIFYSSSLYSSGISPPYISKTSFTTSSR